MNVVKTGDVQLWGLPMEHARGTNADGRKSSRWLPEIDQILLVGMKHGSLGIRQATSKVVSLRAGLTRADCWKRLRFLRERSNGNHPAPRNWPPEIKDLLRRGYEQGGQEKRQAIKAVRELYPGLPSHTPSRFARRQGWTKEVVAGQPRPWAEHEERKLWELAGYEPAARIGQRLGRSEGAVRCRLKMLGLSVRVKDGWSLRALQGLLHVGPSKLRRFIVAGSLRVRDPRIPAQSLAVLWEKRIASASPSAEDQVLEVQRMKLRRGPRAYSWGSAGKFLGVSVDKVRTWIAKGDLKIVDGFVTERAFQDFCNKCGTQLNSGLLGEEVRDWLADGYTLRLPAGTDTLSVPPCERHALVTRQCPRCQRRMRGNVFFKHVKTCKGIASENESVLSVAAQQANSQSSSRTA
jgi:hypothetical protein